jgi:hypothetical protein
MRSFNSLLSGVPDEPEITYEDVVEEAALPPEIIFFKKLLDKRLGMVTTLSKGSGGGRWRTTLKTKTGIELGFAEHTMDLDREKPTVILFGTTSGAFMYLENKLKRELEKQFWDKFPASNAWMGGKGRKEVGKKWAKDKATKLKAFKK